MNALGDQKPPEYALPNQSCCTRFYTHNASCHPKTRVEFWALATSPIPCFGQMANRCGTKATPEIERQTTINDRLFYLFPPERQEMENLETRRKEIENSRELQMQTFFDAVGNHRYIGELVLDYLEDERKESL